MLRTVDQIGRPVCFGKMPNGETVEAVTLQAHGLSARLLTYGATLQDLRLRGTGHSLVVGLDSLDAYRAQNAYLGANVGRYANRISGGRARINGQLYEFDRNDIRRHTLHGGSESSGLRNWRLRDVSTHCASFEDELPDGHMGFPGRLRVSLKYRIVADATLELEFTATSDKTTLCGFAHHSYFNLDGQGTIWDHDLRIVADSYLPVDEELIPLGAPADVKDTMFDFRSFARLSERRPVGGLDHNYCLSHHQVPIRPVAQLRSRKAGIELTVKTTEPGLQVYDGQALIEILAKSGGCAGVANSGIALEPQCWPDAPNRDRFPNANLEPGGVYRQVTRYAFAQCEKPYDNN